MNISNNISLELINEAHAAIIFEMIDLNRTYLREWLTFVDNMTEMSAAKKWVDGCILRYNERIEKAFVIKFNNEYVGRVGLYNIDKTNKSAEIGYWLVENVQGRGIMKECVEAMLDLGFNTLALNKIEIKCAEGNLKSQKLPLGLNFKYEGMIPNGEWLNGKYVNLKVYTLLSTYYFAKK